MRRETSVVGVVALVCLAAGCTTCEPKMFVPIVRATPAEFEVLVKAAGVPDVKPRSSGAIGLPSFEPPHVESSPEKRRPTAPQIAIVARFVEMDAAKLAELGVSPAEPVSRLTRNEWVPLYDRIRASGSAKVLTAPRITALPGQRAVVTVLFRRHYVSGYTPKGLPEIGTVPDGVVLVAKASIEGDDVVLSEVKPSIWQCVEFCENTFVAPPGWGGTDADEGDDDDEGPDIWEEPVILVSRPVAPLKRPIRIAAGEAVLLPMRRTLIVIRSSVRKGISEGKFRIQDDATAKFLARFDKRGYPFHHDAVFVLVTAVRVEPSKP